MHDLKCGQRTCKYNQNFSCCAKEILISRGAECTTFDPDSQKSNQMTEAAMEYAKPKYTVNTSVACNAPCLFNKSTKCVANGITVSTSEELGCADCLTFIKE